MTTLSNKFIKSLNVNKIVKLSESAINADKSAFKKTFDMSVLVAEAIAWWNAFGKEEAKAEGITLNMDEFAALYGFSKGYLYKLNRCGNATSDQFESYMEAVEQMRAEGKQPSIGIDSFLKFIKSSEGGVEGDEGGEGEEEGGDITEKPMMVFTCRLADLGLSEKNVSIKITADGQVQTSASQEAIKQAIELLSKSLRNK